MRHLFRVLAAGEAEESGLIEFRTEAAVEQARQQPIARPRQAEPVAAGSFTEFQRQQPSGADRQEAVMLFGKSLHL